MTDSTQHDAIDRLTYNISKAVIPYASERERRIIAAAIADGLGYGGVSYVSEKTKLSRNTIGNAIPEMLERIKNTIDSSSCEKHWQMIQNQEKTRIPKKNPRPKPCR